MIVSHFVLISLFFRPYHQNKLTRKQTSNIQSLSQRMWLEERWKVSAKATRGESESFQSPTHSPRHARAASHWHDTEDEPLNHWGQLTPSDLSVLSLYVTMFMYIIVVAAGWDWSRCQVCFLCKLIEHRITVFQQSVWGIELQDGSITENQDSVKQNSSLIFMWFLPFALTLILLFCTTTYFIIVRLDIIYTSIKDNYYILLLLRIIIIIIILPVTV